MVWGNGLCSRVRCLIRFLCRLGCGLCFRVLAGRERGLITGGGVLDVHGGGVDGGQVGWSGDVGGGVGGYV